ncbi:transmembrane protein 158 [Rhinatrema bivittatum]|uniref:transmembrane protein 158 n=1 Tax=Rhinatrema bivittatum TaxID=194408 RepID=UPI00112A9FFA|nr:transmembrane protein 158 [Rhinatrema bivittatum]
MPPPPGPGAALLRALLTAIAASAAACSLSPSPPSRRDLRVQSPPPPLNATAPTPSSSSSPRDADLQPEERGAACNVSVQRLPLLTSLLVRWGGPRPGSHCDLLLFAPAGGPGRAAYAAAYPRAAPPLLIEHLPGPQQELRLCLGCGRRPAGHRRGQQQHFLQGERRDFCCLDFSLEELRGEQGWRLNRKPVESTLVACFMTLVIIVWSVAALIWPVPIIAGFLPNGMEQRRTSAK